MDTNQQLILAIRQVRIGLAQMNNGVAQMNNGVEQMDKGLEALEQLVEGGVRIEALLPTEKPYSDLGTRTVEAMWRIYLEPDLRRSAMFVEPDGQEYLKTGKITEVTKVILEERGEGRPPKERSVLHPHQTGRILHKVLGLPVGPRTRNGIFVRWDQERMIELANRYGIEIPKEQSK